MSALSITLTLRPHALVADAAELVARHQMLAGSVERRMNVGDVARHQHRVDVGALDQEAVDDVGARGAESDRRVRRHERCTAA